MELPPEAVLDSQYVETPAKSVFRVIDNSDTPYGKASLAHGYHKGSFDDPSDRDAKDIIGQIHANTKPNALPPEATTDFDYFDSWSAKQTELAPAEEQKFKNWLKANPNLPQQPDYDMRGFYKALKKGDPRARATVGPDKQIQLPDVFQLSPGMSRAEMERAGSGQILDFGGHGSETVADILRPILGSGAAEQGANAIKNLYEALPYIGILAGLKGPRGEGIETGIPKEPPGAPPPGPPGPPNQPVYRAGPTSIGDEPPPPPGGPTSFNAPIELSDEAPQGPSRPVTPITAPRPETAIPPPRPETAIPPARPETPIPPARPETSFAADAVAAQPEPAQITPPERPIPAAQAAPEPPEPPPAPVIAPEAVPTAPALTGRAAIGRTIEANPAAPPVETIGDTPIEQGDRDFAALLKDGATKDADLAKFISKPKKAEPIIMQARRLYNDSNGEISPIDLGKRLGINKRTAQVMVKSLDQLAAADEKKLTLTAPTESVETPPAGEETAAEPSQAELEAAGQTSMFGPSPAAAPKPELTLTPQAQEPLPPEAVPERTYTPDRFAGTEETIGAADPNSRVVPRNQIFVSPEHFQYKVGGNEQGAGLSLMGADKFDYNAAKDLLLWYDEKGEIGPAKRYYVVNGHQRLALATRDNAEYVPATVLDSGNSLKDSIAQGVTKENARARGAVLNFQQGRGTSIDAATFMRDGGLTEDELKTHYRQLDLGEKNVKEAIELSKLDNWLWAEVANHRLKSELGAVIGRELPNDPPAQFSIFKRIDRLKEQGKGITPERLDDEITAQKIARSGTFESETKDMFGEREMRKSLVEEVADLWGKARKEYAEGRLHGTIAKKQAQLEKGSTKIDVSTAKQIAAESERLKKEFYTFREINGSQTVKVTREYAAKLAAEPKMRAKIEAQYVQALRPALEEDKVNFRLQPGKMQIEEPQTELPVK